MTLHQLTRDGGADREVAELRRQVGMLQKVVLEEADEDTRRPSWPASTSCPGQPGDRCRRGPDEDDETSGDEPIDPDFDTDVDDDWTTEGGHRPQPPRCCRPQSTPRACRSCPHG